MSYSCIKPCPASRLLALGGALPPRARGRAGGRGADARGPDPTHTADGDVNRDAHAPVATGTATRG